jgi:hypothetical protein
MKKSDVKKMPEYFDRYINLTDDVTYLEALRTSLSELKNAPIPKWNALGSKVYLEEKWTVKDILQHFIDTERVFTYRITAIARGDKQTLIPYDQNLYARNTIANNRTIENLLKELILVRQGTIAMYETFTGEMLHQIGNGPNINYCPLSLGFMIAGHQRWHFKVLKEKYYVLL